MRFEGIKSTKRILFPIVVTLLLILSTFIMLFASADDVPFDPFNPFPQGGGNVLGPTAWLHDAWSNIDNFDTNPWGAQQYGGHDAFSYMTTNYTNMNPRSLTYNYETWYVSRQFNMSGLWSFIPTYSNITITSVKAFIVGPLAGHLKEGWFSIKTTALDIRTVAPWILVPNRPYNSSGHADVDTAYLTNSTLFPYTDFSAFEPTPAHTWDITSLTNWTLPLLISTNLCVMWTTVENNVPSGDLVDYIGLWWQYYANFNYTGIGGGVIQNPSFTDNFNSILWLLIIFAPALALQYMLPKIGYAFGMFLMLFIFGLTQVNFMYVTIIGISAVGIMLYKGD